MIIPAPYKEHLQLGVWYQPDNVQSLWDFKYPDEAPLAPNEKVATYSLATALWYNWLKQKVSTVLDIGAPHLFMCDALKDRGCSATVEREMLGLNYRYQPASLDLVTMVHTFHKLNPTQAATLLSKLSTLMKPDGTLFIRVPDRGMGKVNNADPTAACIWDLHSFLEFLYQNPHFSVVETYPVGDNQRDYLLKPISKRPTVCIGMIAKNEGRDLPRCLKSLDGVADGICLIDTGSTDNTKQIAKDWGVSQGFSESNINVVQYLEASENENGSWKLWNFSKARNQYVEWIENNNFDYVLWMDADDEVIDPKKIKNLRMWSQHGIHGIQIQDGGLRWPHHRLWKTKKGIRYSGRCHEYPSFRVSDFIHQDITIRHDSAPGAGESSNARNLRILQKEFAEEPTPRCAFYLGNTYKDAGKWKEAIEPYRKRLEFGPGYEDEYYFAVLYKGRCERLSKNFSDAYKTLWEGITKKPEWAEFWMELAYLEYDRKDYNRSIGFAMLAKDRPVVPTALFREKDKYSDQPERLVSWCFEHLGQFKAAYDMGLEAKRKIGENDTSWNERLLRLGGEAKQKIVLHRPGALGDILLTLNNMASFQRKNPDTEIYYQCAPGIKPMLENILLQSEVNKVITDSSQRPAGAKVINLVGYPLSEGYPHVPMKKHLVEYFAAEMGVDPSFNSFTLPLPNRDSSLPAGDYITLHIKAGWSPYKNWSMDNWEQVVNRLVQEGITVVQIGGGEDPKISKAVDYRGKPFEAGLAAMAHAKMHMGVDSWTNHATNIIWVSDRPKKTRGVILWGSTQVSAAGYKHNTNISLGLSCQPCFREDPKISSVPIGICPNPAGQTYETPRHACMAGISVEEVVTKALDLWKK